MPATAIILGSTGLVGSSLLRLLLNDEHYTRVKIFIRKPVAIEHEKLEKIVTDFADIASLNQEVNTEVIFSCLGTTRKKTPDIQIITASIISILYGSQEQERRMV
ncbi:NAD(P)H-binding protein [Haoranjiania flava]|uniref:Uncharacterized protein n=1 Tax=Haoranjiania flava TaxID=1856322 RepID=A0AAE3IRC1_9BACT|nr:NAD(P)H-binding protein [Haoranjiania flava]MCU7694981.1 hypothetical protein [Haoranjiania flava]